jgi:cytoskeletal protein CcmA (bactofilin family)
MWGKTIEREGAPAATPSGRPDERSSAQAASFAPPAKATSSVGKTMRVHGELRSDEELYLDGEFEGTLEIGQRLTIGPNGKVTANVKAKELAVKGWIQGNVEAAERIVIMNGASIVGDVKTAGIVIEDGAFFKGGIDILRPETKQQQEPPANPVPAAARANGRSA